MREIRVSLEALTAEESMTLERLVLSETDPGVEISRHDGPAGVDPLGLTPFILLIIGGGTAGYLARVIFAIRRQLAPLCIVDVRDGKLDIKIDKERTELAGKTLVVSDSDTTVILEEDATLDDVTDFFKGLLDE